MLVLAISYAFFFSKFQLMFSSLLGLPVAQRPRSTVAKLVNSRFKAFIKAIYLFIPTWAYPMSWI